MELRARPRWWQALLLIILSTGGTLMVAELGGGAGLYGLLRPSPIADAVYELKPRLEGRFMGRRLETNRWGLRGPEVRKLKPESVIRVVGLGDSHMFGWGMPQKACYMVRLERELNAYALPGVRFEVLNFAAPGYNTVMEAAIFEHKALAFDPDFLLVHFVGNDFVAPHFLDPPRSLRPSQWVLVETVRGLFGEMEDRFDGSELEPDELQELERDSYRRYAHLGGAKGFREALLRIQELASQRQIPTLLMMLGETSSRRRYARRVAHEAGFHVLNPVEYFTQLMVDMGHEVTPQGFEEMFHRGDFHPTRMGHRAYAKALRCELAYLELPGLAAQAIRGCVARRTQAPTGT